MSQRRIIPVTTLVQYVKQQLDKDIVLHGVLVEGEVSNLRIPSSGHMYFSLKDEKSSIACVMFAGHARYLNFKPVNGDKIIVRGDVTLYAPEGRTQILITAMKQSGIGDLYVRFEELKRKLEKEGFFDPRNKKLLPLYPMNIGIITGKETAAAHDVRITLQSRWPIAMVKEYIVPCQGASAAKYIIEALKKADTADHDVILLVRGGGSLEDLWCFNDENLARSIFSLHTPIVTGVGHETDTTLVDYVADKRSITPTAAVLDSTPNIQEVHVLLKKYERILTTDIQNRIRIEKTQLSTYSRSISYDAFLQMLAGRQMHLDYLEERLKKSSYTFQEKRASLDTLTYRLQHAIIHNCTETRKQLEVCRQRCTSSFVTKLQNEYLRLQTLQNTLKSTIQTDVQQNRNKFQSLISLLDAYSPLKILSRGYSLVQDESGRLITDTEQIHEKDIVHITVSKGKFTASVHTIERK